MDWVTERSLTKKQINALELCVSKENAKTLYGGAGFGGKSHLLRASCVFFAGLYAQLGFPGQVGMLVCKDYPSLQDRHHAALERELGHLGTIRAKHRLYGLCFEFHDPALGALRLRNADNSDGYRGTENAYVLVDELTELESHIMGDLLYCLRSPLALPFKPLLAASNPDGIGYSWVKKLWIDKDFTGENFDPKDFGFVQALPQDNPNYKVSNYDQTLNSLPEWKRKARLYGLWDVPAGARFPQLKDEVHRFNREDIFPSGIQGSHELIMGIDWGIKDPYCALWICEHKGDFYVYREDYTADCPTERQAERIKRYTGENEFVSRIYTDSQMAERKRDPNTGTVGKAPLQVYAEILRADGRFKQLQPGYKGPRKYAFDTVDRLLTRGNGYPNLYIEMSCTNLWRELQGAIWSNKPGIEDISDKNPDHAISALYYALHSHISKIDKPGYRLEDYTAETWVYEYHKRVMADSEKALRQSTRGGRSIFNRK